MGFRFLSDVGMGIIRVDLQLGELSPTYGVLRKHTSYCMADHSIRLFFEQFLRFDRLEASRVSTVVVVHFLLKFFPRETHLRSIYNDDEVPCVHMRGELRLVFAPEDSGGFHSDPSQDFVLGVYYEPFFFNFP